MNVGNVIELQKDYYIDVLTEASEQLLDIMETEVQKTVYKDGPGKPEWRKEIMDELKLLYHDVTDSYLEFNVGFPGNVDTAKYVKAMLISYGAGSAAGGGKMAIRSKPGMEVWNEDLTGTKESKAKKEYLLPKEFNQPGNHFVENGVKLMRKHFKDLLEEASRNLPSSLFYENVYAKPR